MKIRPVHTRLIQPGDEITEVLDHHLPALCEKTVIVVSGKVVSLCESRIRKKAEIKKADLIVEEADAFLEKEREAPFPLTIKNGLLTCSAGVDESNCCEGYILHPKDAVASACMIWNYLRQNRGLKELGVLITDSHPTPLRRGVVGVGLGWCGFSPLYSYKEACDLFGRPFKVTYINLLDALAASAVLSMGEGDELTPFCIIENAPKMEFLDQKPSKEEKASLKVPLDEDLYRPLLNAATWKKK